MTASGSRSHDQALWHLRWALILCLIFSFAAVFKGEPHRGYADIREYFEDAERMWLKFDLSLPGFSEPHYNRYPLGLAFLSGPFVYLGVLINYVTGGYISTRAVISLIIPLFTMGSALLLFDLAIRFGVSARAALWSTVVFALASPILTFSRLFYADMGTLFFVLSAVWCWLRSQRAGGFVWLCLCGISLAGIYSTHYGSVFLACGLWVAFAAHAVFDRTTSTLQKARSLLALTSAPALVAIVLLGLNYLRYGSPFRSGYDVVYSTPLPMLDLSSVPRNLGVFARMIVRVPWLLPAVIVLPALRKFNRTLFIAAVLGVTIQFLFWVTFPFLHCFPLRYPLPMLSLAALGLPFLAAFLERKGLRALAYSGVALFVFNVGMFLRGDDNFPSIVVNMYDPADGIICHVWYMSPIQPENRAWGSPMGVFQYIVLSVLLSAALLSFWWATRCAARLQVCQKSDAVAAPQECRV
jgi:hypothetical protein